YRQGSYHQAASHQRHALALCRESSHEGLEADALTRLGEICNRLGDHAQAGEYHQNALVLYRKTGLGGEADALNGAGETLLATGRPAQAHARPSAALTLTRQTGDRYQQARARQGLGSACQATGQPDQARQHWQHALDIYTDLGVPDAARIHANPASPASPAGTR